MLGFTARASLLSTAVLIAASVLFVPRGALADPTIGFLETFPGTDTGLWDGNQGDPPTNPGTGGVDGATDGYLFIQRTSDFRFGSHNFSSPYTGDWLAAGVDRVRFYLNDVNADQAFEIHFSIGNGNNFWQYNTGFVPPENSWSEFTVDLDDSTNFTQIIGFGPPNFALALQTVDRVLIRHDLPPFGMTPNGIIGDLGVDNFLMTSSLVGVPPIGPGLPGRIAGVPVQLAPPYPNPARGNVACVLEAFESGPITMRVVDARGRVVRVATLADGPAGMRTWMWDGRDDAGRSVAAGVYRIHARGKSGGTSRPVVRVD
jgi:hypothetical protein